MIEINVRKVLVYVATAVFFVVAATAQLQGAATIDAFLKAGVSCIVTLLLGLPLVNIIDHGIQRSLHAAATTDKAGVASAPTLAMPHASATMAAAAIYSSDPSSPAADTAEAR